MGIKKWIKEHELFKFSSACKLVGLDAGNMHRKLNNEAPFTDIEVKSLTPILIKYGFKPIEFKAPEPEDFDGKETTVGEIEGLAQKPKEVIDFGTDKYLNIEKYTQYPISKKPTIKHEIPIWAHKKKEADQLIKDAWNSKN